MKSGCESPKAKATRSIELPVLATLPVEKGEIAKSKTSRWRAAALITLSLLMVVHVIQWWITGSTVSPIEPSETMYTLQNGAINAGFIFFSLAILATAIFGRFVCGWGCHIVALQDLCVWILKKLGLTPRPFRSRLLVFVPLIAAVYMFVWPTFLWAISKPKDAPLIPQFTNHLITTEFWATFPTVAVAIPFLFICGFVTVYFLGSKGFCTYGCPYGGVFALTDKFAPGKIRVTDACNQCGHCTATCMANVQVHAEVAQYGMVIDPGCMKHMDCISVCPNDALYFGFGKPSVAVKKTGTKNYSLTWPEEILAAAVFFASFLAVWDVYLIVPMLMALGIASVTTYLALRTLKLFRASDLSFYRFNLKTSGKIKTAGWAFIGFAALWIGLNVHSGWVHYNETGGSAAFQKVQIPDELALAQVDPATWLTAGDRENIVRGKRYLYRAFDGGFIVNSTNLAKLAWLEYLSGRADQAVRLLGLAAGRQEGQAKAVSLYYKGTILNRLGRYDEAILNLDQSLSERPDLLLALEQKGESLWQLGRKDEAISAWKGSGDAVMAKYMLAGALNAEGKTDEAIEYEKRADQLSADDPYFHWMVGLRLRNVGMIDLAEKHFGRAVQLDSTFILRRKPDQKRN